MTRFQIHYVLALLLWFQRIALTSFAVEEIREYPLQGHQSQLLT